MASRARAKKLAVSGAGMKVKKPPAHPSGVSAPNFAKNKIPKHVAVVMDGNGRWAKNRGLPRTEGHKAGEAALIDLIYGAIEIGVKEVSAFAFSTENWKRSPDEVKFLMNFSREVLRTRRDELNEVGVKIRWIGQEKRLMKSVVDELLLAEELTENNKVLTLNMCVNYGGRAEITDAATQLATDVKRGKVSLKSINEKSFAKYFEVPDVDLFLRSSGEMRTSNFLPWQSVYSELIFMDVLWPDVDRRVLWRAIEEYVRRDRRYGKA